MVLPQLNPRWRDRVVRGWSREVLRILHVKLVLSGEVPNRHSPPAMFVANHISWLDIWAINSVCPSRFVSKSEVRDWPVIGWLAVRGGVIFIERARRRDAARVSGAAAEALRSGDSLCVFPEGTTSDGTHIFPFHGSLMQAAVDATAPVWPIALRYLRRDGSINTEVAYAGDTTMAESMRAVLWQGRIVLHMDFSKPLSSLASDRRELARESERVISALANLPVRAALGKTSDPQGDTQ